MTIKPTIIIGEPSIFADAARVRFHALVVQGGEVDAIALETNITNARALATLNHFGDICGVAALKRPQKSYREKTIARTGVDLPENTYLYELGYVFIAPEFQGRGLSHELLAGLLEHCDAAAIFATVRLDNRPMRAALAKAGFAETGTPYEGRNKSLIGLLVRPPAKSGPPE